MFCFGEYILVDVSLDLYATGGYMRTEEGLASVFVEKLNCLKAMNVRMGEVGFSLPGPPSGARKANSFRYAIWCGKGSIKKKFLPIRTTVSAPSSPLNSKSTPKYHQTLHVDPLSPRRKEERLKGKKKYMHRKVKEKRKESGLQKGNFLTGACRKIVIHTT